MISPRIGIITLSASNNCGSCLQAYALKKILEPYGIVEIINFTSQKSNQLYGIFPSINVKNLIIFPIKFLFRLFRLFYHSNLLREKKAYDEFRKNYLEILGKKLLPRDLESISKKYDILFAGSDQIWNVCMYDFNEAFFAYWAKCKKIAYAPSLGGHDIRESPNRDNIIKWIKDFDALSTREDSGKECLESITDRNVYKVLDPTLMLNLDDYKKIIGETPIVACDYIFYYSWAYRDDSLNSIVMEESKKTGMPVYVIDSRKWIYRKPMNYAFKLSEQEGPIAFLNLMYYAKRCYVESFHGMIFAYMFKKNFWLLDTHENFVDIDARLKELIVLFNAQNRVLTASNKDSINQSESIFYGQNHAIDEMRKVSRNYIEMSLL